MTPRRALASLLAAVLALLTTLAYGYLTLLRLQQKKQLSATARRNWIQKKSTLESAALF